MKIDFIEKTTLEIDAYTQLFETICMACIKFESFYEDVEITIVLTNDEDIKAINNNYRNINKPTDVLSFPALDAINGKAEIIPMDKNPENNLIIMGDIIISIEKAVEQAYEYNHSLKREISFLLTHSMFHLMGYDHKTKDEEKIMMDKQKKVLDNLGIMR